MRILFVYSFYGGYTPRKPLQSMDIQFGISYLSSLLKQRGHETHLMVLGRGFSDRQNRKTMDDCLKKYRPQLVCFTAVSTEYPYIVGVARYIKDLHPEIFSLIGGPHVSLNPDTVLLNGFDALCVGEGEGAVLDLVTQLDKKQEPSGISNLWIKHGIQVERNLTRPFLQDLDSLPFPDREMWREWKNEGSGPSRRLSVLVGRGCPFKCTYCCNHSFQKLASGPYVRFRSPDNIVREIKEVHDRFPSIEEIYLEAETIGANQTYGIELCAKLEQLNATLPCPLRFGINLRVTPRADFQFLFMAMRRSNFKFVYIGLESGSERLRRTVLKRNYSNEDVVRTVQLAKSNRLQVGFYNLIGFPGETPADFQETVRMNRLCEPDSHGTSIFYPYPGTDLHRKCQEQGLIHGQLDTDAERSKAVLDLPGFSRRQIQQSFILFDYYVYRGRKPTWRLLLKALRDQVRTNPWGASLARHTWAIRMQILRILKSTP